jgi:hypothetical protein
MATMHVYGPPMHTRPHILTLTADILALCMNMNNIHIPTYCNLAVQILLSLKTYCEPLAIGTKEGCHCVTKFKK